MKTRRINLALQGGGAHGAFTWGVLDRLLEEPEIEIAGISGTSAGALNGAALKAGLLRGGREGARENLDWFWGEVDRADDLHLGQWLTFWPDLMLRTMRAFIPSAALDGLSHVVSPYDYGPFYVDPLRQIAGSLHFDHVCSPKGPALFVSATNVRTGKIRVFSGAEITVDALMASACLPTLFRTVEIDDPATGRREAYWDGGYSGNPALFPLFDPGLPNDIVVVNINPLVREEVPHSAADILNRVNEISFNSSLLRELRAINFVRRLIGDGKMPAGAMKDVFVHMIADDRLMTSLGVDSKYLPTTGMLAELKAAGRKAAARFLREHGDKINRAGSVDLQATYS
ncbi:MAG: patatin-like phospholipase family protein [Paracoccaceae bacterium]